MNSRELEITDIFFMVTRHIKSIILVALCFAIAAFSYVYYLIEPVYNYSGSLMIYVSDELATDKEFSISQAGQSYVLSTYYSITYVELLESNKFRSVVQKHAVEKLVEQDLANGSATKETDLYNYYNGVLSVGAVGNMTTYTTKDDSLIFRFGTRHEDSALARAVAESTLEMAPIFSRGYGKVCELKAVDEVSGYASKSSPYTYAMVGFLVGFVLMAFIHILINMFDRRIKDEVMLGEKFDIPVLGIIPSFADEENNKKKKSKKSKKEKGE